MSGVPGPAVADPGQPGVPLTQLEKLIALDDEPTNTVPPMWLNRATGGGAVGDMKLGAETSMVIVCAMVSVLDMFTVALVTKDKELVPGEFDVADRVVMVMPFALNEPPALQITNVSSGPTHVGKPVTLICMAPCASGLQTTKSSTAPSKPANFFIFSSGEYSKSTLSKQSYFQ